MSGESADPNLEIVGYLLHHLDLKSKTCEVASPPKDASELNEYLAALLSEVQDSKQSRSYELEQVETSFCDLLTHFSIDSSAFGPGLAEKLAQDLLEAEIETEERYKNLAKDKKGLIKKGSFLQCIYLIGKEPHYLAVKIEHESFIHEDDFSRKFGLGESRKLYKACMVLFDEQKHPVRYLVFDTNQTPAVYWTRDVFGLKPVRNDAENTKVAIKQVVTSLGRIKSESLIDYNLLRNASIAAFKKKGVMNFDSFVEEVFASYEPHSKSLKEKWPKVVERIAKLLEGGKFDGQFNLVPSAVGYTSQKIKLDPQMTLVYEEGAADLESKVWASKTKDGRNVVVIDAPDAIDQFQFKEW